MLARRALFKISGRHLSQYQAHFFLGHRHGKMDLFFNVTGVSLKGDNYFGQPEVNFNNLKVLMATDDKKLRPHFVNSYIKQLQIAEFGWFNDQVWRQHHPRDSQSIAMLAELCSREDIEHAFQQLAREIITRDRALRIWCVPDGATTWTFDYGV